MKCSKKGLERGQETRTGGVMGLGGESQGGSSNNGVLILGPEDKNKSLLGKRGEGRVSKNRDSISHKERQDKQRD